MLDNDPLTTVQNFNLESLECPKILIATILLRYAKIYDTQLVAQIRHCLEGTLNTCKTIKEKLQKEGLCLLR